MFLNNKYTKIYYKIINRALLRNHLKERYDGFQSHHIMPRCAGGGDSADNLVLLTYKEHRVCHCLLVKMTEGIIKYKLMYAYKLFNRHYNPAGLPCIREYLPESYVKMAATRKTNGSYKRGKDNIFSSPEIIEQVRQRMVDNNPMKAPEQRKRMSLNNNNPNVRPIVVDGVTFPTINAAARYFNTSPYLLKKQYTYCLLDV